MPENENTPTVTGEVNDGWYTTDIEGEIPTFIPTVHSGAAVSGLSLILFSDGFLFAGPLLPLCPISLGISVVASLVQFGVFLTLRGNEFVQLYSAAATV